MFAHAEPETDEKLAMIRGTSLEFLVRNGLEVMMPAERALRGS